MKNDNQHLDFLLSQYVDGALDSSTQKHLEQQLMEPTTQTLLREHREVQELLEDWGSRLPMIDWNDFDQKLASKLNEEAAAKVRKALWHHRLRPVAAAAALLMAALIGYAWHSETTGSLLHKSAHIAVTPAVAPVTPLKSVQIIDEPTPRAYLSQFSTTDYPITQKVAPGGTQLAENNVQIDGMTTAGNPSDRPVLNITDFGPLPGSVHAEATDARPPNTQPALEELH